MDRGWVLAGLLVPLAAACDSAADLPPEARITYDTIGGIEHVISGSRGTWSASERWTLDTEEAVSIGTLDGAEEYTFGEVTGVAVADDGRIYVADTQALEVRVYSAEGEFLFRFGRNGEGPGELSNISGLVLAPGGIAVLDGQQARVTVFTLEGELVGTSRLQRPYVIFAVDGPMAFDEAGRFHDRTVLRYTEGPDSIGVVTYAPDGTIVDSTALGPQQLDFIRVTRGERPIMGLIRPFTARPTLAFGPGAEAFFTQGDRYQVTAFSPYGEPVRVLRRGVEPRPVTDVERDSARDVILERARENGGDPPQDLEIPFEKAIIADLEADDTGHLWIQSEPDPDWSRLEWWVHDSGGRYLGVVVTPRMEVMHIGADFVAGVRTDELGVDRVMVIPLRRP